MASIPNNSVVVGPVGVTETRVLMSNPPGEGLYRKLMSERAEIREALAEAQQQLAELGLRLPPETSLQYSPSPRREYRVVNVISRHTLLRPTTFVQLAEWCRERTGGKKES
jgi:hypothetical protein